MAAARGATVALRRGSNVRRQPPAGAAAAPSSSREHSMPTARTDAANRFRAGHGRRSLAIAKARTDNKSDRRGVQRCPERLSVAVSGNLRLWATPVRFSCLILTCYYYYATTTSLSSLRAAAAAEVEPQMGEVSTDYSLFRLAQNS